MRDKGTIYVVQLKGKAMLFAAESMKVAMQGITDRANRRIEESTNRMHPQADYSITPVDLYREAKSVASHVQVGPSEAK